MNEIIKFVLVAIACCGLITGFFAFVAVLIWILNIILTGNAVIS